MDYDAHCSVAVVPHYFSLDPEEPYDPEIYTNQLI